jgi:putative peptidoglycan lipid II flippase
MLSGLLNARSRFAPGAAAPILLNLSLIAAMGFAWFGNRGDDLYAAWALAIGVSVAGLLQLLYLIWETRRAGVRLKLTLPRLTPEVRRLGTLILPATFGAGIYQISQLVDTFFATSLPQGSLTLLKLADRLNQMPLGIVGIALGTAILPMLSRHIHIGNRTEAQRLQTNAFEIATLLTLPAATALAICAPAFVTAFFVGGKFRLEDGTIMAQIVVALVAGLPAYVIVKILNPGFFAREDTRTPVWTALASLIFNVFLNFYVVRQYGIVGLAAATACSASLNCLLLYAILHRRGWFHFTAKLAGRIGRQAIASAMMGAALWLLMPVLSPYFGAGVFDRIWSLITLVGAGMVVFFGSAYLVGAIDPDLLAMLRRRRPKRDERDDEILEVQ